MDEAGSHVIPIGIEPKLVYGIRSEVIGNVNFNHQQEVIYPVEGVLIFHDYMKNKQRFLKLPPNTTPTIIKLNPTRLLMAVVEITNTDDKECNLVVYDILTFKRVRAFQLPTSAKNKAITRVSFTCDSNALVVLTEYPDEMLYMLIFDRSGTVVEGRAGNSNHRGMATCISCNPQNQDLVAVCGDGVLKLMIKSEKGFTFWKDMKPEFTATSLAWINPQMFILGTKNGILMLFEDGIQKATFRAKEVYAIDLIADPEVEDQSEPVISEQESKSPRSQAIMCMTSFAKGLAYAIFNQVYVFEKVSKIKYERKTILDIPPDNYPESTYEITNMSINAKQDTVIVTPMHRQIYVGLLIVPESLDTKRLEFSTLGELIHIDEITNVCTCSWRPIVVSSSKDKTIRMWNYQTERVELVKQFTMNITAIELFASGQYIAVGFEDKVKVMQIFMNDLNTLKAYGFPNSKDIKFSYFGHLMATAYEHYIGITSVFILENIKTLKGHNGIVTKIVWARDDKSIFSAGDDGTLYQWDILTGARLQEIIDPGTKYNALCVPNEANCFYAATDSGIIKQIKNSKVVLELMMPLTSPLSDIALTRSDMIMFAATKSGQLYNVHMPMQSSGGVTTHSFFNCAITKLCFSFDGTLLISSSASGTLVIWKMKNIEGRVAPIDHDLLKSHEVLIPRRDLEDKIDLINTLEQRLKQQAAEFYKKQSQNEENEQEQIADTHKGYCEALNEMKTKNEETVVRHTQELTQITSQIDELIAEHKTQMDNMSELYSERMLMEYQKFSNLRENMLQVRDSYEEKLAQSKACLHDTAQALEKDFKKQLTERQELIRQLMQEMDAKHLEFIEYCRKIEIDNDRQMIDCQIEYEKKVKFERDETAKWKEQFDSYQFKFDSIRKEADNLLDEVNKLKDKHYKTTAYIAQLRVDIKDLEKDIADREEAIRIKEARIDQILTKNKELDKYKLVLNHKIKELKAQIEPRELQIIEKQKQIIEMEHELNGLHKNNLQLELQLKELKDKYISTNVELKKERARSKSARTCITDISTEIYKVAAKVDHPDKLRQGIKHLFCKYSSDDALKKFVSLDTQTQADLQRQRAHIEKLFLGCRYKMQHKSYLGKSKKLETDHKVLKDEVHDIIRQNENTRSQIKNMEILVKIISKSKSTEGTMDLKGLLVGIDKIEKYFVDKVKTLGRDVKNLFDEHEKLCESLESRRKMIHQLSI